MNPSWLLTGATKDRQTITARWTPSSLRLVDGVTVREVLNVPKANGYLTEIFRREWVEPDTHVDQVFQVVLEAGAVSAWHGHASTLDRLFVASGLVRIVLFDGRENSPTQGVVNELRFGTIRPALVTIPPQVWHGVQNMSATGMAVIVNLVDRAYDYDDPDHWRLPADTPQIPFRF